MVHLSAAAVKNRIGRLMRRLGAKRRAELSAQAPPRRHQLTFSSHSGAA